MQAACRWMLILAIFITTFGLPPALAVTAAPAPATGEDSPVLQNQSLALVGPAACPSGGCAAGQRLSMRFSYDPAGITDNSTPNAKICFFAPVNWGATDITQTAVGEITTATYDVDTTPALCEQNGADPTNYVLIREWQATLSAGDFADAVTFSFRIGRGATANGLILARLFIRTGADTWAPMRSATSPNIRVTPASAAAYVANDAAACGSYSPCYLNSADDLPDGIGTGLKDAVDAAPDGGTGTIQVVGTYTIKSSSVIVNRPIPITITAVGDATITFNGPGACSADEPMLTLQSAVTLRGLNIIDGSCTAPNRHLIRIDSAQPVEISSNDLYNGDNAIEVADNTGPVTIQFNDIRSNAGKAIFFEGTTNGAPLNLVANNLSGNGIGTPVDCNGAGDTVVANRRANHNYWGDATPAETETHCSMSPGKRLGMAIAHKSSVPGVDAQLVTVGEDKIYSFSSQIAYERSGGADFPLYIVNHGYATAGGPPFTSAAGGESPSPCSNYWDIFLPQGTAASGTLELYFKYDKTPGCQAAINSSLYCDQTSTPGNYPLFWYDPATNATKWWDNTALRPGNLTSGEGQITRCDMSNNEIQVSIDGSGRPDLTTDLAYAPFMVGVPVIKSFLPLASSRQITITWTTNNEPDINGFYILRRPEDEPNFTTITDLIPHTGTALVGKAYSYADSGRTNGVRYYYRLQVVRSDGASIYSEIKSVVANVATITPTLTIVPTFTRTIQYTTPTRTFTRAVVLNPTRVMSRTPTPRLLTPSATFLVLPTITSAFDNGTPGTPGTPASAAGSPGAPDETGLPTEDLTPGSGTPIAMLEGTPTPTSTAGLDGTTVASTGTSRSSPWLSLLLGILTGAVSIGAIGGWWYFRLKR